MSLLYECINTVIAVLISISSGMPNHSASIQLCVQKLRILIEDSDQNLKYLGLLAMSKILKTHPKSVQTHKDLILACLDDKDESIRLRALDLLYGMVSKKNLMEIVRRLLGHMERAEGSAYRDELLFKVIEICSQGSYQYVTNFEWYLTVLVELIQLESGSKHGKVIATQLLDVAIRVQAVRTFAVNEMSTLLASYPIAAQNSTMHEVLYAAAWIVGEFGSCLDNPEQTLNILLQPRQVPGHIQAVYVQNATKLFANLAHDCLEEDNLADVRKYCDQLLDGLPVYLSSGDIEVQERASSAFMTVQMLKARLAATTGDGTAADILDDVDVVVLGKPSIPPEVAALIREIRELFVGDLNPVAPKAQRKVQLPEGLDLDEWINTPPQVSSESSDEEKFTLFGHGVGEDRETTNGGGEHRRYRQVEQTPEEMERLREARILEQTNNPNYLKPAKKKSSSQDYQNAENYDEIPIAEIALEVPLQIHSTKRSDKYLVEQQKSSSSSKAPAVPAATVKRPAKSPSGTARRVAAASSSGTAKAIPTVMIPSRCTCPIEDPRPAQRNSSSKASRTGGLLGEHLSAKAASAPPTSNDIVAIDAEEAGSKSQRHRHKKDRKKSKKEDKKEDLLEVEQEDKKKRRKKTKVAGEGGEANNGGGEAEARQKQKKNKKEKLSKSEQKKLMSGYEEALGISTPSKEVI
ncbi:hypothetical protein pipiens_017272 [Culex pipiens pipiens]|uniref:AP-3 complex subunit delta domain-containing protein n=1 Tax=Culex pipiens pipiens TaxID=38569 RepID=A0ABD1CHD8_CULPP